jgi:hypothetical protein
MIDHALSKGLRGLAPGSSLAKLLEERGKKRNKGNLPPFTKNQILAWADAHRRRTGKYPSVDSGPIAEAPNETWRIVQSALVFGNRGLPGGDSLAGLIKRQRQGQTG